MPIQRLKIRSEPPLAGPRPFSREGDAFMRRQPNIIYNTIMKPMVLYACRGLVWYRAEWNSQSMFGMVKCPWWSRNSGMLVYGDVLKKWVQRYRKEWSRDDFQFMVVMLPGYGKALETEPKVDTESPVAHTIDLGDAKNVHPKDKLPIGQRLALLAARDALGRTIEVQGSIMKNVEAPWLLTMTMQMDSRRAMANRRQRFGWPMTPENGFLLTRRSRDRRSCCNLLNWTSRSMSVTPLRGCRK